MTIPEAVQLVLSAGAMGKGGEVFVLDMGEQLKVIDLARDLIRLSGYSEEEIGISFTGLKPGEKMYEELFYSEDDMQRTAHDKILVSYRNHALEFQQFSLHRGVKSASVHTTRIRQEVDALIEAAHRGDLCAIDQILRRVVPQYTPAREYGVAASEQPEPPKQTESAGKGVAVST
jgi:FlaA1/EpsC-like NDP-sugar epimerase